MYQLNVITPALMTISISIESEIAMNIPSHVLNKQIHRNDLFNRLNRELSNLKATDLYLESIKGFVQAILEESNASTFKLQIEAIPAYPKINPIFKSRETLPEENRKVTVVFKDKDILSNIEYCQKHERWHSPHGDLKVNRIHQWAYTDELYPQLNLPEITEDPKNEKERSNDEIPKEILKMLLLAAVLSGKKSKSDFRNSPFNI
ncbi:hypothetical protein [Acinetobacter guillouiae]|uniref:hypothetical protein n=1 Tax=Acinetobacter guillouiae TaxID=106649 RepID=UPI0028E1C978|nr:hypothetical protein [Acinetobacter guillouiae]